ncbi:formamidopyrimidine-DNA glycosylase-like [Cucumis melo var. makuwa]|uniref:Formamidopyrimidine-DNA glycosylase-like n=1 Tax=Cucumis melo var. makuwa TaxID=1194695 RepID=A0A5A7T7R0_CUCMM|nr:formamidopyrimidine-DNA glycosylase-like [Cucumis melo var. makuwa]TYK01970.1 formamidopyrimidine-DNA glycosylase-like [Cucumis melo var. makuwa]
MFEKPSMDISSPPYSSSRKEKHKDLTSKKSLRFSLIGTSLVDPMAARKGDLVLYFDDLFPTEARKLPSYPKSYSMKRKGKPTHPSASLRHWCSFTKRLSTVHLC